VTGSARIPHINARLLLYTIGEIFTKFKNESGKFLNAMKEREKS